MVECSPRIELYTENFLESDFKSPDLSSRDRDYSMASACSLGSGLLYNHSHQRKSTSPPQDMPVDLGKGGNNAILGRFSYGWSRTCPQGVAYVACVDLCQTRSRQDGPVFAPNRPLYKWGYGPTHIPCALLFLHEYRCGQKHICFVMKCR